MTFGQFDAEYRTKGSSLSTAFEPVAHMFLDFHPDTRPVLSRVLIAQAVMLRTLASIRGRKRGDFRPLRELSADDAALLKWDANTPIEPVLAIAYDHICETYRQIAGT